MATTYKQEVDTKCPYFLTARTDARTKRYEISCEGVGAAKNTMCFLGADDRDWYTDYYCSRYPNDCYLCKANDKKYEDS